jgi:S-adenosyl methyltransferase
VRWSSARWRSKDEFDLFLHGLELVDPGITPMSEWRPELEPGPQPSPSEAGAYAASAREPQGGFPPPAGFHPVADHEGTLFLGDRRDLPRPQGVELGEVGIHRRGVQNEQPRGLLAVVAEGVPGTARHQFASVAPRCCG